MVSGVIRKRDQNPNSKIIVFYGIVKTEGKEGGGGRTKIEVNWKRERGGV